MILSYPLEDAHWTSIDWKSTENNIALLQHRIAKATLNGDCRKVRHLQRLLVRSLSARLKAVRQVSQENSAKVTPGIDGELWRTPKLKLKAATELRKRFNTMPLRRISIPKRDRSLRPLAIPRMVDRARQALWNMALTPVVKSTSDSASYGFPPYRGTWDAQAQIRVVLSRQASPTWVLDAAIQKCFDTINHHWLLTNTPMEKRVLRSWLKSGLIDYSWENFDTEAATLQGGVLSTTLSNHALNGLQDVLQASFPPEKQTGPSSNRRHQPSKVNLVRYAHDFIVTGCSPRQLERVRGVISDFLRPRGLVLHPTKTRILSIYQGFDFLGWTFRKTRNTKLLGTISRESITSHRLQIKRIIKRAGKAPPSDLISKLNPVIRGWCNYHRCANDIWKAWNSNNQYLYRLLWKWVRNRHLRRSRYWIYDKYWKPWQGRKTFVDPPPDHKGKASPVQVTETTVKLLPYRFTQLPLRQIRGNINVFLLNKETKGHIGEVWSKKQGDKASRWC